MSPTTYRPDIDGLRAVAVAAVVAYHVSPTLLPAGFLGVDIFFVISGYLITGIILREMSEQRFSFLAFYSRRVRRIFPALIAMIMATLAGAYFLVLPPDFSNLADSARWAALGGGNFFFWGQSDYFAPVADRMPLLHTWSLGVEEQFYLAWPLLMVIGLPVLARLRLPRSLLVLAVIVASLAFAFAIAEDATALFYSPLSRAWELGLGAAVAFVPPLRLRLSAEAGGLLGAGLIGTAIIGLVPSVLWGQIAACVGATILVYPKDRMGIVAGGLSLRPVRFTGAISYSVYLWHWPILTLYRHYFMFGQTLRFRDYLIYFAVLTLVSVISWAFIERPFRNWRPKPFRAVATGAVASLAIVLAGSWIASDGLSFRFSDKVLHYISDEYTRPGLVGKSGARCFLALKDGDTAAGFTEDLCISIDAKRPNVLLVGDSHSNQFIGALRKVFPEINFSQAGASGCYMLLDDRGTGRCMALSAKVYGSYLEKYHFDAVIVSARWRLVKRWPKIAKTVEAIRSHRTIPIFLGPSPEYKLDVPSILSYGALWNRDLSKSLESNEHVLDFEKRFKKLFAKEPETFFSPYDVVCPKGRCMTTTSGDAPMLQDENHLSAPGAVFVITELRKLGLLKSLLNRPTAGDSSS